MPANALFTFNQAEAELQARLGNRTDLGTGSANRLAQWLNSAQLRVAAAVLEAEDLDSTFQFYTVDGQSQYSELTILPPLQNPIGIKGIRNNTTGVSVRRFPWNEFRSLNQQAQGPPLRWARFGTILALDPQPDSNGPYEMLVDYRMQPQYELTQIPNRYQEDWISVAEWIGWKALMKVDRASAALAMMPGWLQVIVQQPLDRDQWESRWDDAQVIAPIGMSYPYTFGIN